MTILFSRLDRIEMITEAASALKLDLYLLQKSTPVNVPIGIEYEFLESKDEYLERAEALIKSGRIKGFIGTAGYDKTAILDAKIGEICEKHGVPHISPTYNLATTSIDKEVTREILAKNNLNVASGMVIKDEQELKLFIEKTDGIIICKDPLGISGRGQYIITDKEIPKELKYPTLAEEFLDGIEFGLDTFTWNNEIFVLPPVYKSKTSIHATHAREKLRYSPYKATNIPQENFDKIAVDITEAMEATGWINIDCILVNDEVYILEINSRFSGTSCLNSLTINKNVYEISFMALLGEKVDPEWFLAKSTTVEFPLFERIQQPKEPDIKIAYTSQPGKYCGSITTQVGDDKDKLKALSKYAKAGKSSHIYDEFLEMRDLEGKEEF